MEKPLTAIDISLKDIKADAEASYRIPDEMVQFLKKLEKDHAIIGFRWDGSYRFDVILKKS